MISVGFKRVTKKRPCRICGNPTYCGFSRDEGTSICMRISTGTRGLSRNGGNIHVHPDIPFITIRPRITTRNSPSIPLAQLLTAIDNGNEAAARLLDPADPVQQKFDAKRILLHIESNSVTAYNREGANMRDFQEYSSRSLHSWSTASGYARLTHFMLRLVWNRRDRFENATKRLSCRIHEEENPFQRLTRVNHYSSRQTFQEDGQSRGPCYK